MLVLGGLIAKEPNQYSSDRYPATEYWLHLFVVYPAASRCLQFRKNLLPPPIHSFLDRRIISVALSVGGTSVWIASMCRIRLHCPFIPFPLFPSPLLIPRQNSAGIHSENSRNEKQTGSPRPVASSKLMLRHQ